MKKMAKKGFTLVELLAVIVILAIIAVIAVPSILGIIEKSREDAFKASLRNIFKAVELKMTTANSSETEIDNKIESLGLNEDITGYWSYSSDNKTIKLCDVKKNGYTFASGCITKNETAKDFVVTKGINLDESGANRPDLNQGMIPVYYDGECNEPAGCWKKADVTNTTEKYKWYDYNNDNDNDKKMWANAVTVIQTGSGTGSDGIIRHDRSYYQTADTGTPISMDDINTMWVWIPRYKYAVPSGSGEREIAIVFEEGLATTGNGETSPSIQTIEILKGNTSHTDYITHPAFTFGEDEVAGIWVGKFETGYEGATTTTEAQKNNNLPDQVIIKPNVFSWRSITVENAFETSREMQNNATFGFNNNSDIHMMKNMEWGAVAYLSHSEYGQTDESGNPIEIGINNYSGYKTGCGEQPESLQSTTCHSYNNLGKVASTTGNIYGVYDMSGGALEYVMGNFQNRVGDSGFKDMPEGKYYDLYDTNDGLKGDATNKDGTDGWYSDTANFVYLSRPWFVRGGFRINGANAGAFRYDIGLGYPASSFSWRLVQLKP